MSGARRVALRRLAAGFLTVLLAPAVALGHAVVHPESAPPGAYQKYVLRVPNERDVPTTRVELSFPEGVRVVSFAEVQGWTLEVVTDDSGRIRRAIWTGALPALRFVEFPFVAVNPLEEARLLWPAVQVYAGGERVEWSGSEGSETPASVTLVRQPGSGSTPWVASAALLVALVSLGFALRPGETGDRPAAE